ncbi:MAG: tetratricopeptide repeat protein [Bacteroidales bacterium]|jgi:tetratricopeptide (TPR) repeat protein|nr:tetratricopeptide repeat protein [Bacteroidales bacterium]
MKKRENIFLIFLSIILTNCGAYAQNNDANTEKCNQELSTYSEYFKQNNFHDAYPSWSWCFNNCPQSTKNIYIQGATIIENIITGEKDSIKKEAWVDTLMLVYDNRIKYFDQKALVLGRKALSMLRYRGYEIKSAYDILEESFKLGKETSESFVLDFYMTTTINLYNSNILTKEDVLNNYESISETYNIMITNEANDTKREKLEESAKKVEDMFVSSGVADCEAVINMFTPKFKENPTDVALAKKIVALLNMGNSDECKLSDLYIEVATLVYSDEKTANAAHSLAQAHLKRKNFSVSEKFYLEAINLETEPLKKADMYYELALVYYMNSNYPSARNIARSCLANNPNAGKAYILIGKIYGASAKNCVESVFDKKATNCLIVDQFIKAKNIDPSVAGEANELIGKYTAGFPKTEDGFWLSIEAGATFTVGCWINETTTIRFSD